MTKKRIVNIAKIAIDKNLNYEELKYSDYLYGKEKEIDNIWSYVEAAKEHGISWFRETYSKYLKT